MYMKINHRRTYPVTAPVMFHMSDSPAVCKVKATVSNMVKFESTERPTMEEVKRAVDSVRGKLIVSRKKSYYPIISRTLQVYKGSFNATIMPNMAIIATYARCVYLGVLIFYPEIKYNSG